MAGAANTGCPHHSRQRAFIRCIVEHHAAGAVDLQIDEPGRQNGECRIRVARSGVGDGGDAPTFDLDPLPAAPASPPPG